MLDNWNCPVCKIYNDILTNNCISCQRDKPLWLTTESQLRVEIRRGIWLHRGALKSYDVRYSPFANEVSKMTEQEELFARFYNEEKILVKDMNSAELREHREILSKIAFEAKAKLGAVDDIQRERNAKTKNKEFILTDNSVRQSDSDSLNAPKIRAARMSQVDKMRQSLEKLGFMDEATINEVVANMEKRGTDSAVKSTTNAFKKIAATPIEKRIEAATADGTITDSEPKINPFAKFAS